MLIVSTHPSDHRMTNALKRALADVDAPGWAIVCGDRHEMAVEALRLHYQGVKLAHVQGGDTPHGTDGHPDHRTRDAISMLARLHFVANEDCKTNLAAIGITEGVYVTGNPGLDEVVEFREVNSYIARHSKPLILMHPHPSNDRVSREWHYAACRAAYRSGTIASLADWLQGNADDGGKLSAYIGDTTERLSQDSFLAALMACKLFITNSSAGLLEAPILGTPVELIGDRQAGRSTKPYHHPEGRSCETLAALVKEFCT